MAGIKKRNVLTFLQARDMTSDSRRQVLYVADYKKQVVHRVPTTAGSNHSQWSVGQRPNGLSLTMDTGNVLVSCSDARRLIEFTSQGCVLRDISIRGDIVALHHAVTLMNGQVSVRVIL